MVEEMRILSSGKKPYFRISIVKFGSAPETVCEAKSENDVKLDSVASLDGGSGGTDAATALAEAIAILNRNPGKATDFVPYVFFLSDGEPDDPTAALAEGAKLKSLSIAAGAPRLITLGFGQSNDTFMQQLASNTELYKRLRDSREVTRFFPLIGSDVAGNAATGADAVDQAIMNLLVSIPRREILEPYDPVDQSLEAN
jgi:uncharacterized protein YegL